MNRRFYPGAPRDIDEAARRIHRLLFANDDVGAMPIGDAQNSMQLTPQSSPAAIQLAQVDATDGEDEAQDPLVGWPPSSPILDRIWQRNDSQGQGGYGDPRPGRLHAGVDFGAPAGTTVYPPIGGTIRRIGWAYEKESGHPEGRRTIHIEGPDGHIFKLLYVAPIDGLEVGQDIAAGAELGTVQDWQGIEDKLHKKGARTPEGKRVTDHVHVEVFDPAGILVDPTPWFDKWVGQSVRRRQLQRLEERYHR